MQSIKPIARGPSTRSYDLWQLRFLPYNMHKAKELLVYCVKGLRMWWCATPTCPQLWRAGGEWKLCSRARRCTSTCRTEQAPCSTSLLSIINKFNMSVQSSQSLFNDYLLKNINIFTLSVNIGPMRFIPGIYWLFGIIHHCNLFAPFRVDLILLKRNK